KTILFEQILNNNYSLNETNREKRHISDIIIQIIEALFKTKSKALNHVIKHLFMVTVINA
ncbi:MAG: hypothetical protein QN715_03135, partial [Nitrososphaeraceae archaeon]|nr:hypothetical protein [Nitrososphaeraceae archaeon]